MPVIPGRIINGAPFVYGLVVLRDLGAYGYVWFLVDTGATGTCLHPRDARALGVDLNRLTYPKRSRGIGGSAAYSPHDAFVLFSTNRNVTHTERLAIAIAEPTPANLNYPSLLGRDVLNRWAMSYAPKNRLLRFDA